MTVLMARLRRLPGMAGAEIRYRAWEAIRKSLGRAAFKLGTLAKADGLAGGHRPAAAMVLPGRDLSLVAYLREIVAPRFYLRVDEAGREQLRETLSRLRPEWITRAVTQADSLMAHRIEILGFGEIDLGPTIDWHRDPVTGETWERRFWSDYDLVHGHRAGDPKTVHELNRHQHLPRLAKAYVLTGEERYAREVVDQLLDWIEHNPPGIGVNWHSSLEISLRAVSWLWALMLVVTSPSLDERAAERIGASLRAQLDHVLAHPSIFSSPNTHLLGEATALFVAGTLLEGCAGARNWRDLGQELLLRELDRQFFHDGVHGELSTWYHCYAVDSYLQVLALARHNGHRLPLLVWQRIESMLDFLLHVTRPDGTIPLLGDDDGGRALALDECHYTRAADLLCAGAVLFGRGDCKHVAGGFAPAALWLLGPQGWREYDRMSAAPPVARHASFRDAGYFVTRTGWEANDSHLIFDCGGLGKLGGGHGHADALSLTLSCGGKELLVDPGSFAYGDRQWRDRFRSTAAHNTVVVDGREQSDAAGAFRWSRAAVARLLLDASAGGIECVAGEHDGYSGPGDGVIHRRRVLFVRPDYWLVLDDFRGRGEHTFDIGYHVAADAVVTTSALACGGGARLSVTCGAADLVMALHASAPLDVRVARGGGSPLGWVSHRYGAKRSAPVIVARMRAHAPAMAVTLLAPHHDRTDALTLQPLDLVMRTRRGALASGVALAIGLPSGQDDVIVLSPNGSEVEAGPIGSCGGRLRARAEVSWARIEHGRMVRAIALSASAFEAGLLPTLLAVPATVADSRAAPPPERGRDPEDPHVWHRGHP